MPRPLLAVAACSVLAVLAGCTSDGGDDEKDAFCVLLDERGADLATQVVTVESKARSLETADLLLEASPAEIEDEFETIHGVIEAAAEIDPADNDAVAQVLQLALQPEVVAAARRFNSYALDECGIDLNTLDTTETDTPASTETTTG